MKLDRTTACNLIEIKAPRWKQRVVGIAAFRIGEHNEIKILARDKDGMLYYPNSYYMKGEDIRKYKKQVLNPSGIVLHLVPINDLQILERV